MLLELMRTVFKFFVNRRKQRKRVVEPLPPLSVTSLSQRRARRAVEAYKLARRHRCK